MEKTNDIQLIGESVILRVPAPEDFPVLFRLIHGEEHTEWRQYNAPYFPHEAETYEQFAERMTKRIQFEDVPNCMVIEHKGEVIGEVSFYWEYKPTRWLETGIVIYSSEYWSGGLGTEAMALWIDHLFSRLEIGRVGLTTWSGNPRMIRSAEKLGMMLEGRMRRCRYYNGVYYDSIRMGMLREEWEEHKYSLPVFPNVGVPVSKA